MMQAQQSGSIRATVPRRLYAQGRRRPCAAPPQDANTRASFFGGNTGPISKTGGAVASVGLIDRGVERHAGLPYILVSRARRHTPGQAFHHPALDADTFHPLIGTQASNSGTLATKVASMTDQEQEKPRVLLMGKADGCGFQMLPLVFRADGKSALRVYLAADRAGGRFKSARAL
jgi:hypothetical protein